ncbi:hypothetical protein MBOT_12750 [Mycobacterium botniense]|uniref:Uncharacterized protein n=1 Tax=Mycobacterium botniense TaxID=84962 RepID=A0A7I9XVU9_9MYCO|nr:hypothetical protein MBOT_12750 [Mycobacterium botniense]
MFAIGAVPYRINRGQVPIADPRHRTACTQCPVQECERLAAAIQQWKLRPQTVDQLEQAGAEDITPIRVAGHPATLLQLGE